MWTLEHGKLISLTKSESNYIRKDRLIPLNTQGICQSLELFCPSTIQPTKLPWNKFWTIDTKDWVLSTIKLDSIAMSLAPPIVLADISTVQELYSQIKQSNLTTSNSSKSQLNNQD